MSKELEYLVQLESLGVGAWWLQIGNKLKPDGEKHYWNLMRIIATGQETSLSEHIRILDGYDYRSNIKGLEHLQRLNGRNTLVLGNHSHLGPLEGYGEMLLTSYCVKKATGKEIKWVRGRGKSLKENARQLVDRSLGTIPVYDDSIRGPILIFKAFDANESVGLYPEGDNSIVLRQAKLTAGNLVLKTLGKNIPVFCASTWFENNTFFATFAPLLDEKKYKEIQNTKLRKEEKDIIKEKIINYAMARIAQNLPEEKRGYYRDFQKFIDAFEAI
ncbi:MAG: hypothetical protein AAB600_03935 [Patescibacteria group bacterium]